MKRNIFCFVALFCFVFCLVEYAIASELNKPWFFSIDASHRSSVRSNDSEADQAILRGAFSGVEDLNGRLSFPLLLSVFSEIRYNYDSNRFRRIETGFETGVKACRFFYFGESFQYALLEPENDTFEAETLIKCDFPIGDSFFDLPISLYLFEEYTYSITLGEATRNEVGIGFNYALCDTMSLRFGWRHLDNIHDFDADQVEVGTNIKF